MTIHMFQIALPEEIIRVSTNNEIAAYLNVIEVVFETC